jgi:hypothetical protein
MARLTTDQARKIHDAFGPATGSLWRPRERMELADLSLGDPDVYRLVTAALDAMHRLTVELHCHSVGHGVGRLPTDGA